MKNSVIKVKYHSDIYHENGNGLNFDPEKGNWIDLRADDVIHLKKNHFYKIPLGVSIKLPEGYEAHIVPRSSTFQKYGIIQTNGIGIVDSSYCGDDDEWLMPVLAMCDCVIPRGDRICQFRILPVMSNITIEQVEHLEGVNRGGFGSTGRR